jgi:hypothetical protein
MVFLFLILCSLILAYILYAVAMKENNDVVIMGATVNEVTKMVELKLKINNRKIMKQIKAGSFLGLPIETKVTGGIE